MPQMNFFFERENLWETLQIFQGKKAVQLCIGEQALSLY